MNFVAKIKNHKYILGLDEEKGQIAVTSKGGLYRLRNPEVTVSVTRNALIGTNQHLSIKKLTTSSEVLQDTTAADIISDIICMDPKGMKLQKHALVRFPYSSHAQNIKLLCRSDVESESCQWLCVPQKKKGDQKHPDSIFWFLDSDNFCNVFTLHNTTLCLVDDQEDKYTRIYHDKVMTAVMTAKYVRFEEKLEVYIIISNMCHSFKFMVLVILSNE